MEVVALPTSLGPMQPELAPELFHRAGWVYEEKYDGWRIVAYKDGDQIRLMSRPGVDHASRFPEVTAAIAGLVAPELILDGEICVFDEQLVSQIHLLNRPDPTVNSTWPVASDCLTTARHLRIRKAR